ncbi:heavy-metal-associated domain-containing protein [Microbacterium sp. VKM Ac-2870]|uniref:heavy-metal-associated domain-containing protein n=1 Tax=Microbacterium sp. VKM Ac-2870 TaxID=2783825 RepID=UPI00188CAB97|nr:heavy-metal-associated domain-containing protein [Microbacterium sp. VKM Ac-2870]MBF4561850.1 heavy-metal-associated domain-containing protein [Microbacterium sp. VKM Ac-2870]
MTTHTYTVEGMTCAHCAGAVSREVGKISGVSDIAVDVTEGTLTVTVDGPAPDSDIVAAVDEAGYAVVLN